jgi:hypothetical protein
VRNALNYISQYSSLFIFLLCVKCFLTKQNVEYKGAAQTGKIVCERETIVNADRMLFIPEWGGKQPLRHNERMRGGHTQDKKKRETIIIIPYF